MHGSPAILILPAYLFPPKDANPHRNWPQWKPHLVTFTPTLLSCVPTAWIDMSWCTCDWTRVLGYFYCSQSLLEFNGPIFQFDCHPQGTWGSVQKLWTYCSHNLWYRKVRLGYLINFLEESLYFLIWAFFWCVVLSTIFILKFKTSTQHFVILRRYDGWICCSDLCRYLVYSLYLQ